MENFEVVTEEPQIPAAPRYASWRSGPSSITPPRKLPIPVPGIFLVGGLGAALLIVARFGIVIQGPSLFALTVASVVIIQFVKFVGRKAGREEMVAPTIPWDSFPPEVLRLNVLMDVVQGEAITGSDSGVAWMEQGALCFAGSSTSFALSRDLIAWDALRLTTEVNRPFERSVMVPLIPGDGAFPLRVQFDVPVAPGEPGSTVLREMLRRLKDAPRGGALRQLPPRELGPGAFKSGEATLIALMHLLQWICFGVMPMVLVGYSLLCRSPFVVFWLALAILGVVNSGFSSFRRAVDAKDQLGEMRAKQVPIADSASGTPAS